MRFTHKRLGKIAPGQDGAICGGCIFRFDNAGHCTVIDFDTLEPMGRFALDRLETVTPHSNAVCFGPVKYAPEDEFPLLYTNVYNTYQREADRREGMCCVYRITRQGAAFSSTLVQTITIGFTAKKGLWRSENAADIRPYGNFLIDSETNRLWAYTMLDENRVTRFFAFDLPAVSRTAEGPETVVLPESAVIEQFDGDYTYFMQGAVLTKGHIITGQGFTEDQPGIRMVDLRKKADIMFVPLLEHGLIHEPELFETYDGRLFYSDVEGNFYEIELNP